jgi:hypothetical protein
VFPLKLLKHFESIPEVSPKMQVHLAQSKIEWINSTAISHCPNGVVIAQISPVRWPNITESSFVRNAAKAKFFEEDTMHGLLPSRFDKERFIMSNTIIVKKQVILM